MASPARRVAICVVLLLAAICAAGPAHAACREGRATGQRGDRLIAGFTPVPPFVVRGASDGEAHGIAIDLLRTLAAREGWRVELVELGPETLRTRLAACELDLAATGAAASAALAETFELSQPYLSTVTTAIVDRGDDERAAPAAGGGRAGRLAHVVGRALLAGAAALGLLALASWLLNAFTGFPGGAPLRLRRLDAAVSGPWAGLGWLARSVTGRVLVLAWIAGGCALGALGALGATSPVLGEDPLRALVERAAHREALVGERYPDGAQVTCSASEVRDCFHSFADGTLDAIAGPREVLCLHADALSLDRAVLRDDLAIPEHFVYVLPPGSPLRARLDLAILREHERAQVAAPRVRCPERAR